MSRTTEGASQATSFDLHSLLGYRLQRLSASIGRLGEIAAAEVARLTLPEFRVLVVLHNVGPCGVVALQNAMLIDKAWISRTLAALAVKGFVLSRIDPVDARRTMFRLTPKGKLAAEALIERAVDRQRTIFHGFTPSEIEELKRLLVKVEENVQATLRTHSIE